DEDCCKKYGESHGYPRTPPRRSHDRSFPDRGQAPRPSPTAAPAASQRVEGVVAARTPRMVEIARGFSAIGKPPQQGSSGAIPWPVKERDPPRPRLIDQARQRLPARLGRDPTPLAQHSHPPPSRAITAARVRPSAPPCRRA